MTERMGYLEENIRLLLADKSQSEIRHASLLDAFNNLIYSRESEREDFLRRIASHERLAEQHQQHQVRREAEFRAALDRLDHSRSLTSVGTGFATGSTSAGAADWERPALSSPVASPVLSSRQVRVATFATPQTFGPGAVVPPCMHMPTVQSTSMQRENSMQSTNRSLSPAVPDVFGSRDNLMKSRMVTRESPPMVARELRVAAPVLVMNPSQPAVSVSVGAPVRIMSPAVAAHPGLPANALISPRVVQNLTTGVVRAVAPATPNTIYRSLPVRGANQFTAEVAEVRVL